MHQTTSKKEGTLKNDGRQTRPSQTTIGQVRPELDLTEPILGQVSGRESCQRKPRLNMLNWPSWTSLHWFQTVSFDSIPIIKFREWRSCHFHFFQERRMIELRRRKINQINLKVDILFHLNINTLWIHS